MGVAIIFSGKIGAGKTTISKQVAGKLGWEWVSFGETVREIGRERNLATTREALQTLGEELVDQEPEAFCVRTLGNALTTSETSLIIDGLRHIELLPTLRRLLHPRKIFIVLVTLPFALRLERVREKSGSLLGEVAKMDRHSTEVQIEEVLTRHADLIVDNSGSVEDSVREVLNWICGLKAFSKRDVQK